MSFPLADSCTYQCSNGIPFMYQYVGQRRACCDHVTRDGPAFPNFESNSCSARGVPQSIPQSASRSPPRSAPLIVYGNKVEPSLDDLSQYYSTYARNARYVGTI